MKVYISIKNQGKISNNAGKKAPEDINTLCEKLGWKKMEITRPLKEHNRIIRILESSFKFSKQWNQLKNKNVNYILYQYPMYLGTSESAVALYKLSLLKKIYKVKIIVLIHDIEYLRIKDNMTILRWRKDSRMKIEKKLFGLSHAIICHNKYMRKYLISQGIAEDKIVSLELFDYICDSNIDDKQIIESKLNQIAIAGNLDSRKSGFIYELAEKNPNVVINLYGVGHEEKLFTNNMKYRGCYTPEELPKNIDSAFGLVWDGPEISKCAGIYGNYLRYNNPHKLSLYMAAGIPVIVWKQAAIAEFVKNNNVGILLDDLYDLQKKLENIDIQEYQKMIKNCKRIGDKVRNGYFFENAIIKAMNICSIESTLMNDEIL